MRSSHTRLQYALKKHGISRLDRMPRLIRLCMNVVRLGICLVCLIAFVVVIQLFLQKPETDHQPRSNEKLPVYVEKRRVIKDAVFDPQALRAADPSRDKIFQVGRNPFLPEDGTGPRRHPIIPHILHQTWDSEDTVPRRFVPWLQSWAKHHPGTGSIGAAGGQQGGGWEHWIWSPQAVLCLLERHYPEYATLYRDYPDEVSRADVMRYFVLHRYGGVYADLDTESLKSLDPWTYSHQCILSEEPYEHSFLVREANRSNIVNSPMACRPRHPFFAKTIDSLTEYAGKYFGDFLHSTGPYFLDSVYRTYCRYDRDPQDNITVVPPRYFLPTYDPSQTGVVDDKCTIKTYTQLPPKQKQVCAKLMDRDFKNEPYLDSYMDHHWLHVNMMDPAWKLKDTVVWEEVMPKVRKMSSIVCDAM